MQLLICYDDGQKRRFLKCDRGQKKLAGDRMGKEASGPVYTYREN
jgi:hypothetical protein